METKTCTVCNKEQYITNFYRYRTSIHIESYISKCKACVKIQQDDRKKNTQAILYFKICSICNIDKKIDQYYKSYRHKDGYFKWCDICHENKVKNKGNNIKIKRTPEYMIQYNRKQAENPMYKFKHQVRSNLHSYLRKNIKSCKNNATLKYIGCSLEFLKRWFEFNFDDNMNWENRGIYWHIDHIRPCDSYDLTKQEEIYNCYHWKNLRPLEKYENISKSNKIDMMIIHEYEAKSVIFLSQIDYTIKEEQYELLPEVKALCSQCE
jgi:hypothetical protein